MAKVKTLKSTQNTSDIDIEDIISAFPAIELTDQKTDFQCITYEGFYHDSTIYFNIVNGVEYVEMELGDSLPDFFIKTNKSKFIITTGARFIDRIIKKKGGFMIYPVRFETPSPSYVSIMFTD